jgi:type I restriction enzyme S subunit
LKNYVLTNPKLILKKNVLAPYIEMSHLSESSMCINNIKYRKFIGGSKFQNNDILFARITPCLENGKTAFINVLNNDEIAAGSTEFIVMRAKEKISPYWVYFLAKDDQFRTYAISSMIGSSGRQRVHEKYLELYELPKVNYDKMNCFHQIVYPFINKIKATNKEIKYLNNLKELLLSKLAKAGA